MCTRSWEACAQGNERGEARKAYGRYGCQLFQIDIMPKDKDDIYLTFDTD